MTTLHPLVPRNPREGFTGIFSRFERGPLEAAESDFHEWLMNLWGGRYLILGSVLVFLAVGGFYIWHATPVYQAEAMLQVDPPRVIRDSDAAYSRMESQFSFPTDVSTEIEILGSNLVLGRTVEALALDVVARPVLLPFIGEALARGKADAPRVEVDTFSLPDHMRGLVFQLTTLPGGSFAWKTPLEPPNRVGKPGATYPVDAPLAVGQVGQLLVADYGGESIKLKLRQLVGEPGQKFQLCRNPLLSAITEVRGDLEAGGKGATQLSKSTNLLALTYRHTNPVRAAEILNEIMSQYVRQNSERKNREISRTLEMLQQQLPMVHSKLKSSENHMSGFRAHKGAVDVSREADLALQQSSNLAAQISALKLKKQELLRTYQEGSDIVGTLNAQIAKLEGESAEVREKVRSLPGTQQAVVQLGRDVQVNTELYTTILNNIRQLQITQAAEGRNTRVVDLAIPDLKPIKPKRDVLLTVFFTLGLCLGLGLVLMRAALGQALEDHRVIEAKLGLPVLVTVPHSKVQEVHYRSLSENRPGSHLLAQHHPEDLATESLRSLRTMLGFSMTGNLNRAIMITGPSPKVGKSFISSNFALVLAQTGLRVLVVDGDLRKGNLHKYFGLPNRLGGLSEVIAGLADWKSVTHRTDTPGLVVMSSGSIPQNPTELLSSKGFDSFLREVLQEYDHVVIDAPPVLPVTDALIIGAKVGTVLLVAKFGRNNLDELRTCMSRMAGNGIPLKGCVFNDVMPTGLGYYDQRYRYAYHYKYG